MSDGWGSFVTCVNNIQWSAVSCCFFAMLYCHLTLLSLQRKLVVFYVKTQPLLGDDSKEAHISDMLDFLLDIPIPTSQLTNVTWNGQVCVCFVFTIIQIIMCILCACAYRCVCMCQGPTTVFQHSNWCLECFLH